MGEKTFNKGFLKTAFIGAAVMIAFSNVTQYASQQNVDFRYDRDNVVKKDSQILKYGSGKVTLDDGRHINAVFKAGDGIVNKLLNLWKNVSDGDTSSRQEIDKMPESGQCYTGRMYSRSFLRGPEEFHIDQIKPASCTQSFN